MVLMQWCIRGTASSNIDGWCMDAIKTAGSGPAGLARTRRRTLDVASSSTRMRVRCSSARAMHSSCRCPVLMLLPPSTTGASRPPCVAAHLHSSRRLDIDPTARPALNPHPTVVFTVGVNPMRPNPPVSTSAEQPAGSALLSGGHRSSGCPRTGAAMGKERHLEAGHEVLEAGPAQGLPDVQVGPRLPKRVQVAAHRA